MSTCLLNFFFYLNNKMFGHILLLFCFGAVAHSPSFMGMEIWRVDQLLLFQKVSSVVFGVLNDILLSVPAFHLLFASRGTGAMLCPSLLREPGSVPSTELECKPSSTFPFPPLPSLQGPFCASHPQAGGSWCLSCCPGALCWVPVHH